MGLPRAWRIALDDKISRAEFESGSPVTQAKADKTASWHVMPYSPTPLPRPEYPGPVVMVVPRAAVPLIEYNGTTAGGGGLVAGLDWVAVSDEEVITPTTNVIPTSIGSAVLLGRPTITTSSSANTVIFGCNAGNPSGGAETVADRISWFGRVPMQRWYYGVNQLPSTFSSTKAGGSPEKKVQVSFKWQPSEVNNGTWDQRFDSYCTSIPADWYVEMTPWHEPNAELNTGSFTATAYRNMVIRLSNRLVALGLTNRIIIAPNYTFPRTGGGVAWSDSWMLSADELHDGAIMTWDTYGNPPPDLDTGYPNMVTANAEPMFTKNETYGWEKWGVTEFNAPRRNNDLTETTRVTVLDNFVDACVNDAPTPPVHMLLWEGNGNQFNQNFFTNATKNWYAGWVALSPAA